MSAQQTPGALHVLVFDPSNRSPSYLAAFAEALAREARVTVLSPLRDYGRTEGLEDEYAPHLPSRQGSVRTVLRRTVIYAAMWLRALCVAKRFDVIHIQWLGALDRSSMETILLRLLMFRNPRIAYTVHNVLPNNESRSEAVAGRYRWVYRRVPLLFVHTEATRTELISEFGISGEKIRVVQHGPLLRSGYTPNEVELEYTLAMIGFVTPYKGAEDAIEVVGLLRNEHPGANLLIAGRVEPTYKKRLIAEIESRNLGDAVIMIDRLLSDTEVIEFHRRSRMVIFPYRRISQSGAVMTAVGLGTPIVGYDVGGLCEAVHDGVNGLLVPGGSPSSLAQAAASMLDKYDEYVEGAGKMRSSAQWCETVDQTVRAYRTMQ